MNESSEDRPAEAIRRSRLPTATIIKSLAGAVIVIALVIVGVRPRLAEYR